RRRIAGQHLPFLPGRVQRRLCLDLEPNVPLVPEEIVGAGATLVEGQVYEEGPQFLAAIQLELSQAVTKKKTLEDRLEHVLGVFFDKDAGTELGSHHAN